MDVVKLGKTGSLTLNYSKNLLMTLIAASVFAATSVLADIINQESFKTHLRWNLLVPREQLFVVKRDQTLFIETVNLDLFEKIAGELAVIKTNGQYIEGIGYSKENFPARPATITVKLSDPSVELFSFYRDADKKYILDFWINTDLKIKQRSSSKEEAKSGFETYAELRTAAELVKASTLKLAGLMTMGTLRTDDAEAEAKRCFHELNELKERLESEMNVKLETSMGMSQDYEIALAEKSNWIRLGTMMFS